VASKLIKKNKDLIKFSSKLRKKILDLSFFAGASSSHFGGALSSVEILATLFGKVLDFNKYNFKSPNRDRFILSKGHACMVYYSALNILGIISNDQLKTFEKDNSDLPGHPVKNLDLGIDFSTGSLGMGLSLGIGVALALKRKKIDKRVFVLLGDGECNEGSVWEAALSAPNLGLNNLTAIIDNNNFQQTGTIEEIMNTKNLEKKWKSFNWKTAYIDGHNTNEIYTALKKKDLYLPSVIICKTIKGKGFKFSENNNDWHHKIMTKDNYKRAIKELNKK
jgi:transketolase